jgi:LysM repeat protein
MTVGRGLTFGYLPRMRHPGVYRRRRLGALLAATAVVYVLYANAGAAEPGPHYHTVEPGDTLWRIATEHYAPGEDPREKVEEIRLENGLEGYGIRPGARLELPR